MCHRRRRINSSAMTSSISFSSTSTSSVCLVLLLFLLGGPFEGGGLEVRKILTRAASYVASAIEAEVEAGDRPTDRRQRQRQRQQPASASRATRAIVPIASEGGKEEGGRSCRNERRRRIPLALQVRYVPMSVGRSACSAMRAGKATMAKSFVRHLQSKDGSYGAIRTEGRAPLRGVRKEKRKAGIFKETVRSLALCICHGINDDAREVDL